MHPPNPPAALHALSGLNIAVDDAALLSLRFGDGLLAPAPLHRSASDLRAVLRNADAVDPSTPVYTVYRGVTSEEVRSEIERRGLLYAVLVLRAGSIGQERARIRGHINSHAAGTPTTYPEVYEIWQGRALLYLQCEASPDVSDVVLLELSPGNKAIVPPGWASLVVNIGEEPLVAGSWLAEECRPQYAALESLGGMAHYVLAGSEPPGYDLEPNPQYRSVPAPRSVLVQDYPNFGLTQDEPMFTTFRRNPDVFRFMTRPQDYAGIWTTLYS